MRRPWAPGNTRIVAGSLLALTVCLLAVGAALAANQAAATIAGTVSLEGWLDVSGAVVWLEPIGRAEPAVDRVVVLDQRGLDFEPHIVVIRIGTTVEFRNSDAVLHNIFAPDLGGEAFDLGTWPAGEERPHRFETPGITVVLCNVHPEMEAFVVVVPGPWHTVVDEDGAFVIDDVAAGEYRLVGWHERGEATAASLTVTGGERVTQDVVVRRRVW